MCRLGYHATSSSTRALAKSGALRDLSSVIDIGRYRQRVAPTFIDLGTVDGHLVGVFARSSLKGLIWYEGKGEVRHMPALAVPSESVIDTNGAGDVFHGAYVYSYLKRPRAGWGEHFRFARGASAHKIQHLGNEAGLPELDDIEEANSAFDEAA